MDLLERLHPRWYRDVAQMVLPHPTFAWLDAGSQDSADVAAFGSRRLLPRVLVDVAEISTRVVVGGSELGLPILSGPVGIQRALHPDGELAMAAGLAAAGAGMVIAASTTTPVDEIGAVQPPGVRWMQLAGWRDRGALGELVDRAREAGISALVPIVNQPVAAVHAPPEAGFRLPDGVSIAHTTADPSPNASQLADHIEWLVERAGIPVLPKGVMHPADARTLVSAGAAGVIVSNHGARQLKRAVGALDAVEAIADELGTDADVVLDGGVRSGSDVFVALASGARAVLIGRPLGWALAVGGAAAVTRLVEQFRSELLETAALCGVTDLAAVPRELLAHNGGTPA